MGSGSAKIPGIAWTGRYEILGMEEVVAIRREWVQGLCKGSDKVFGIIYLF